LRFSLSEAHREAFGISSQDSAKCFVLKVCGYNEYIWGRQRIIDFAHIRNCVCRVRCL